MAVIFEGDEPKSKFAEAPKIARALVGKRVLCPAYKHNTHSTALKGAATQANNYKWSITFKNCESLYCISMTYNILHEL